MSTTETPENKEPGPLLGLGSSAGLGLPPERAEFERYFAGSRKSKGVAKRPTFERRADDTYNDDHTQRHWWTWQKAQAAEREWWEGPREILIGGNRYVVRFLEDGASEVAFLGPNDRIQPRR